MAVLQVIAVPYFNATELARVLQMIRANDMTVELPVRIHLIAGCCHPISLH